MEDIITTGEEIESIPQRRSLLGRARGFFAGDTVIWLILIALMLGSIVVVFSAVSQEAFRAEARGGLFYGEFLKHLLLILVSFIIVSVMSRISSKFYQQFSFTFILLCIGLLVYTLVAGAELNEGKRWISLFGFTIQPSEISKVAVVNYVAFSLWKDEGRTSLNTFIRTWWPVGAVILLIVFENISTAAFIFLITVVTTIIGGINKKYTGYLILAAMAAGLVLVMFKLFTPDAEGVGRSETGHNRIMRFVTKMFKPVNEETYDDIMGMDYQVVMAQKAIANSNLIGKGAGRGELRQWLPAAYSDYIYNVVVEEYGLAGSVILLFTYIIFFWRCGKLANQSRSNYKSTLLYGIGLTITGQAVMNMMVATNLLPVTGQTLPFISKGGSSYIFMSMFFGLALSVSREIQASRRCQEAEASGIEGMPEVDMEEIPDYVPAAEATPRP